MDLTEKTVLSIDTTGMVGHFRLGSGCTDDLLPLV